MTSITIHRPATVRVPRAAPVAAELAFRLLSAIEHFVVKRRARQAEASRIAEAAVARQYADLIRATDPRMASEICAAADRHEIV